PLVRPLQSQQAFRGRDADPWDKGKEARRRILRLCPEGVLFEQPGEKSISPFGATAPSRILNTITVQRQTVATAASATARDQIIRLVPFLLRGFRAEQYNFG
ncbi:hypothetical protein, partial [Salinibacter ruber]|uniref:hypothetical protein n=1 Tax=Salinibacter ruber TaxID=146919 RepID=UPI002169D1C8